MPGNAYHLVSHWRVRGTPAEVADILGDAASLPKWWGSVYRQVELLDPGDGNGVGKRFRVRAAGWLPYALRLTFRQTEQHYPNGFSVAVEGDLNGSGAWTFIQDGDEVDIRFDWTVSADKAVLRWFSPLLKPLFASNHRWTMRRGEQSLRLELERRRATTPAERALIPPPPQPFQYSTGVIAAGVVAMLAAGAALFRLARSRSR